MFRIYAKPEAQVKPQAFFQLTSDSAGGLSLGLVNARGVWIKNLLSVGSDGRLRLHVAARPVGYDLEDVLQFDDRGRLRLAYQSIKEKSNHGS